MIIIVVITSLLLLKLMNLRKYSLNVRRSVWNVSSLSVLLVAGWCAVVGVSTASAQVASTISTNWVSTPANSTLWMSAVFNTSGTVTNGETFYITKASVSIPSSPTTTVNLPNAEITYSTSFTTATTSYNAVTSTWVTDVPLSDAGKNVFMTGGEYVVPSTGLTNLSHVAMTADFAESGAASAEVMWQWSATAYKNFSSNLNALGVQVINGSTLASTPNSYAAMANVEQGGTGVSGCNVLANPSGQACLSVPPVVVPEPSSALLFSLAIGFFFRRARRLR